MDDSLITKESKLYESTTADNIKTWQYITPKNAEDSESYSQTQNFKDRLSYTKEDFEIYDNFNLKTSSIILNQEQAKDLHESVLDKPITHSGEFNIATHNTNSKPSRDGDEKLQDITSTHSIFNQNDIILGYLTDNGLRETLNQEVIITRTGKPTTLNALGLTEVVNNPRIKSSILHNYLGTSEVPSIDATLMSTVLSTGYYNVTDKRAMFISDKNSPFTQTVENASYFKNIHSRNTSLSNNVKTSYISIHKV